MLDIEKSHLVLGRKVLALGGGMLETCESIRQRTAAVHVEMIDGAGFGPKAAGLPQDDDVAVLNLEMTTLQ